MYIEIIPLKSINLSHLTYSVPKSISVEIGDIIKIPFKTTTIKGIVVRKNIEKPKFNTKNIPEQNAIQLGEKTVELMQWMSHYYICPMHIIAKLFFPEHINGRKKEIQFDSKSHDVQFDTLKLKSLSSDQTRIINAIQLSKEKLHLIHGVTGSGKTEIFIHLMQETILQGKQALVLLPEIALTPQTEQYFKNIFNEGIVLMHSRMTPKQKYEAWKSIYENKAKIIVGARSALFTPLKNLGLIIVDECHEESYKQDNTPMYSANRVCAEISRIHDVKCIYASATPPVEMYYHALKNADMMLHSITHKLSPTQRNIEIIDMREEAKKRNYSHFSEQLLSSLNATLARNEQAILFVNRRGTAHALVCKDCGFKSICDKCNLAYTYHEYNSKVWNECHQCGQKSSVTEECPTCHGYNFKQLGFGTEKVVAEMEKLFPGRRILRADRDTTGENSSIEDIYNSFKNKEADILVGTQMIAKGWDIENVTLVGILMADIGLNIPDFRAGERVFQLLTQVSGRTARGEKNGHVLIQTYNPENTSIQLASREDYIGFYTSEIENRKKYKFPPFIRMIRIEVRAKTAQLSRTKAETLTLDLSKITTTNESATCVPDIHPFIGGTYRHNIFIRTNNPQKFIDLLIPTQDYTYKIERI